MHNLSHKNTILLILIYLYLFPLATSYITAETKTHEHNTTLSPWLSGIGHHHRHHHRHRGCRHNPLICYQQGGETRRLCCRNRCVEVDSDPNNCGCCRVRCPFTWQCCLGICRNINSDNNNCGACGNKCSSPEICAYGLCGYVDEPPPMRFPPKPGRGAPAAPIIG